jgi:hypothetical protein
MYIFEAETTPLNAEIQNISWFLNTVNPRKSNVLTVLTDEPEHRIMKIIAHEPCSVYITAANGELWGNKARFSPRDYLTVTFTDDGIPDEEKFVAAEGIQIITEEVGGGQ